VRAHGHHLREFIPASDQHTGKVPALSPSAMSRPSPSKTPNDGKIGVA
jgi:hypothetical protein